MQGLRRSPSLFTPLQRDAVLPVETSWRSCRKRQLTLKCAMIHKLCHTVSVDPSLYVMLHCYTNFPDGRCVPTCVQFVHYSMTICSINSASSSHWKFPKVHFKSLDDALNWLKSCSFNCIVEGEGLSDCNVEWQNIHIEFIHYTVNYIVLKDIECKWL